MLKSSPFPGRKCRKSFTACLCSWFNEKYILDPIIVLLPNESEIHLIWHFPWGGWCFTRWWCQWMHWTVLRFSFLFILLSCSSARCELAQWCAIRSAEEVSSGGGDASAPGCQCFDSLVSVLHSLRLFLHSPVYGRILMTKDLTGHRPHSELYTVLDAQVLLRSALSTSPDTTAASERKNTELHILSLYAWLSVRFLCFF